MKKYLSFLLVALITFLQVNLTYAIDTTSGSANAYVLTVSTDQLGGSNSYRDGQVYHGIANFTNNATATLNINGLGAVTIKNSASAALVGGEIVSGQAYSFRYNGSAGGYFILIDQVSIPANVVLVSPTITGDVTVSTGNILVPASGKGVYAALGLSALPADVSASFSPRFYGFGTGASDIVHQRGSADTSGSTFDFLKSRKTDGTADTIVASGDTVGTIAAYGANGTTFDPLAQILFEIDATPGAATDMPGRLVLKLTPDGSATPTEVLRVQNSGTIQLAQAISMITTNTVDAADNKRMVLAPAGNTSDWFTGNRGAYIEMGGNEASNFGIINITGGTNVGTVTLTSLANGTISFRSASGEVLNLNTSTGDLSIDPVNGGDFQFRRPGKTISIQEGTAANACSGSVTANGTTPVATSTTCWTTGSRVFLTKSSTSTVNGSCYISATSNGVSFTITCLATDTGTYNWLITHEAP